MNAGEQTVDLELKELEVAEGESGTSRPGCVRRIPRKAIVRAPRLLPMRYRLNELAEELEVGALFVRDWVRRGMAFTRDPRGNVWIDGREACAWIKAHRRPPSNGLMPEGWGYCLRCRARVEIATPVRRISGKHLVLSGTCPQCGRKVNRGARNDPA
jgi:hypothetical protein